MTDNRATVERSDRSFPRRRLLGGATLVTGSALAGIFSPYSMDASAKDSISVSQLLKNLELATPTAIDAYTPVALSPAEMITLNAAIDRFIPSDDLGPSASEAGVGVYIDQALAGNSAPMLPLFQAGLAAFEGAGFATLDTAAQDDLINQAAAGALTGIPEGFFGLLLYNTRSGMFGDPVHGGNKDFVGWDLLQYPGIKLVWTEADQQIDAVVTPMHLSVAAFQGES